MIEKLIYKNSRLKILLILIISTIATLLVTSFGILLRFIIDNHNTYNNSTIVWLFVGCFVLIRGVMPISYTLLKYSIGLFAINKEKTIREFFFNLIKNIPVDKLSTTNKSEMLSAYNISMSAITSYISLIFIEFIPCILDAIFVVIALSYYMGIKFGCITAFIIVSYTTIVIKLINKRTKFMQQSASEYKNLNDICYDVIMSLETAKIFYAEEKSNARYQATINNFVKSETVENKQFLNFGIIVSVISAIFCLLILYYAQIKISNGDMSIGELVMLANYLFFLFQPITRACSSLEDYRRSKINFKLIEDLLSKYGVNFNQQQQANANKQKYRGNIDKIEFSINNFKKIRQESTINYQDQKVILEKGKINFLTGKNGIGKSTLAKIISKLDLEHAGSLITNYDQQPINYVYMPQKMILINDTILNNLLHYTNKNDTNLFTQILDELNFTKGLDFIVGNHGDKLSGGEKQKLAIAIALLNEPDCLILDEPTNSIDITTLDIISEKIETLSKDIIILVISHHTEFIDKFANKKIYNIDNTIVTS